MEEPAQPELTRQELLRRGSAAVELIRAGENPALMLSMVVWPSPTMTAALEEPPPDGVVRREGFAWSREAREHALRLVAEGCTRREAARIALGRGDASAGRTVGRWLAEAAGARARQTPAAV